jgi:hypothetical protein
MAIRPILSLAVSLLPYNIRSKKIVSNSRLSYVYFIHLLIVVFFLKKRNKIGRLPIILKKRGQTTHNNMIATALPPNGWRSND